MPDRDQIAFRFVGKKNEEGLATEYLGGIPADHLTNAEYRALTPDQKAAVKASPLYRAVEHAADEPKASPAASRQADKKD